MLQNAYFLAKIGADTAENEQHFAEICLAAMAYDPGRAIGAAQESERAPVIRLAKGGSKGPPLLAAHRSIGQTLQGSFSAVSKPTFASKHALESSRRDLHNALLCTGLKSHFFQKVARS